MSEPTYKTTMTCHDVEIGLSFLCKGGIPWSTRERVVISAIAATVGVLWVVLTGGGDDVVFRVFDHDLSLGLRRSLHVFKFLVLSAMVLMSYRALRRSRQKDARRQLLVEWARQTGGTATVQIEGDRIRCLCGNDASPIAAGRITSVAVSPSHVILQFTQAKGPAFVSLKRSEELLTRVRHVRAVNEDHAIRGAGTE